MALKTTFQKAENGQVEIFEITIPSGTKVSNSFVLRAYTLVAVKFPTMTSTVVNLQDSLDGTTFDSTYNTNGDLLSWTIVSGSQVKLLPADTAGFIELKLSVDSNEAADRVIKLICRSV